MKIPTPHELGLPEKFDRWRPSQEEALHYLLNSQKRMKAVSAPTGFGKTAVYVAYALITKEPTCIVTDSRALQDQLMEDFSSVGLTDIRGRRNYPCDLKPDYTCEEGYNARCPYRGTIACPSSQAEMRAATSSLVVTNYAKWTAAKKYGQGMQHFKQVIFDEGHEAPNALAAAKQVVLNHRERERHLGMDAPSQADNMAAWKLWAVEARDVADDLYKRAYERIKGVADPQPSHVRHFLHMRNLCRRLATLATAKPADWVVEEVFAGPESKGFQFDPVRPGRYAESALMFNIPSVVVISATLRPKTLFMLGQGKDTFDFKEFMSDFPPERNPIYWVPTMRVDKRAGDLSMLWVRLDQIASKRQDRKGIVHTVSYSRRDEIVTRSRFGPQMFLNERGDAPTEMVLAFKGANDGAILVSPSVGQGFDFPGAECEWQFLCKVPFPPPSKVLKARTQDDPEYPYYLAMQKMVQTFGRGMRSRGDQCENFIADDHIEWFLNRYGHLAPRSFHNFFRRVTVLPQPPERLPR